MKLHIASPYFKEKKRKFFDYDYVFIDIFNNVNFIKHTRYKRLKKDIKEIFEHYDINTIPKLNKFLNVNNLALTYIDNHKRIYLYEIVSLKEYEKEHKIKIIDKNTNNQE